MRFKLPDDARQRRPVVVNLRLLHPALPVGIIKELKDCVKRLIRIVHNIGKPSALIVFEERIACDCHTWQTGLRFINVIAIRQAKFEPSIFTVTNIVPNITRKSKIKLIQNALIRVEDRKNKRP